MKRYAWMLAMTMLCMTAGKGLSQNRSDVFVMKTESDIPYRIPAIAALPDGKIVCVADYRYTRKDIGLVKDGRIDLHIRISEDNGRSWGEVGVLVEGKGKESEDFMNVAFGDPCIVADRKSGRLMVLSCAGNISYPKGSRDNHLSIARFYSEDGGRTWSSPVDISDSIYALFDKGKHGPARSMFIASGRIMQSRYVKTGKYHRLYCAVLQTLASGDRANFVIYSDDFGKTWDVLGGTDIAPVMKGADEAKVEELPDGSILISSRTKARGRNLNIYTFSNVKTAAGKWGEMAHSSAHNNGIITKDNACNGELMLLPVIRNSDSRKMYLLLQSVPTGPRRANVGIYYKGLADKEDIASPQKMAADWEGVMQVSRTFSAYSTMAWQSDARLGFLFEECTYCSDRTGGYNIVYDSFTVEEITGGTYRSDPRPCKHLRRSGI